MLNLSKRNKTSPKIGAHKMAAPELPELNLGMLIKLKREERGLSQRELAALVPKSPGTIAHWELNHAAPSNRDMRRLQGILGIAPGAVLLDRRPYAGELVERPDELALLHFWRGLGPDRQAAMVALLMHPPAALVGE